MAHPLLRALGISEHPRLSERDGPGLIPVCSPATLKPLSWVRADDAQTYEAAVEDAARAFARWREVPAPVRGQVVRAIGDELRKHRDALGELISLEVGKIRAEGIGEVQEAIDIADFAVGLSRQLYGRTMPSERPNHRIMEQWHPLGVVGVISAFNFPHAVWAWNAMIAAVCGDAVLWKPSLLAPLTAIASNQIAERVAAGMGHPGVFGLVIGADDVVGERLIADRRIPLVSATGSCRMGRRVGTVVAERLGRTILELGGNNACVVDQTADLDLALKAVVFAAAGTAGQRCTSTRRLILHESIAEPFTDRLVSAYRTITIGDPLSDGTLVGPLINARAVEGFERAVAAARQQGGKVLTGGGRATVPGLPGHFVTPTIVRAPPDNVLPIALEETFAPVLYIFTFRTLDEAIALHNAVDQGLSSAIFSTDVRAAERFVSAVGSDCGLVSVNAGTSGAEIGGAFGGEKDTGGGRESGSDAWKAYMRRQTATIHGGRELKLAQGIRFE